MKLLEVEGARAPVPGGLAGDATDQSGRKGKGLIYDPEIHKKNLIHDTSIHHHIADGRMSCRSYATKNIGLPRHFAWKCAYLSALKIKGL